MNIFNYSSYRQSKIDEIITSIFGKEFVKTAMAYTQMQFRQQMQWWDLDEILTNPPESYLKQIQIVPTLKSVVLDVRQKRKSTIAKISDTQNVTIPEAARMVKTYIGFDPAYGAYAAQVGPYKSKGFWWGPEFVVREAEGRFSAFTKRYTRATPDEIGAALLKNIDTYKTAYNVDLEPRDFQLHVRQPKEDQPSGATNTRNEDVMDPIVLDKNDTRFRRVFNVNAPKYEPCPECRSQEITIEPGQEETKMASCNACGARFEAQRGPGGLGPMLIGSSSFVTLNPQGYEKVIRSFFGKYYTQTLEEVAAQSGITSQQVIDRMLTDLRVLKNVYKITMAKYQNAVANREVLVREGQVPPPKFLDDSLKLAPGVGSISYTKVQRTKELRNQLAVMKEVTDHLYGNNETIPPILPTDDIDEIARRLNAKPSRVEFNESRKRANIQRAREGKDALPLALFTPDAIQMYIDMIDVQREKIGEGANKQQVVESINNIEKNYFSIDPATGETRIDPSTGKEAETYGFEDLKTAIYVLKLHMSSVARDKETKAHTAVPNATAFDVPIDMQNVTSKDLAASRTAPKLTKEQREVNQEVLEEEIGKMPEAGKQLVTPKGEEVPLAEGEDPLAGIDVEKTPKQIPQPFPPEEISEEQKMVNLEDIIGSTVKNLIKIASELDENGKEEAAEEIHKIIRKYQARVF